MNGLKPRDDDYIITEGRYSGCRLSTIAKLNRYWLWGWFRDVCQDAETDELVDKFIEKAQKA